MRGGQPSFISVSGTTFTPAASSPARTAADRASAVGSSPCTHGESTRRLMRLPLRETISPSVTMRTTCCVATTGSFSPRERQGVPGEQLDKWLARCGWERLLNRKGTTWRKLDTNQQGSVHDAASAKVLMQANPSAIKRPVVDWGGDITVGFDRAAWGLLKRV